MVTVVVIVAVAVVVVVVVVGTIRTVPNSVRTES